MEHLIELNVLDKLVEKTIALPLSKLLYVVWFKNGKNYEVLVVTSINEETGLQEFFDTEDETTFEYERIVGKWEEYLDNTL